MQKIKDVIQYLESVAPPSYQEDYDNSGLLTGDASKEVTGVLVSLDTTEDIIREAVEKKCNLVISHHPIIFKGLKKLTGTNYVERTIIEAIRNDIAIYAIHTNLDNVAHGVNQKIAQKIGLNNTTILRPAVSGLSKIVTFVPAENTAGVISALGEIGAGIIGNYEECSFRVTGKGTFRPNEQADPHLGETEKLNEVEEERVEMIFPTHLTNAVISGLKEHHPYDEVAYYLTDLENQDPAIGAGMIGDLKKEMAMPEFLAHLKSVMELPLIRHTADTGKKISKVAVCGGAGGFLLRQAIQEQADIFVTSDIKYHEFFDAENVIVLADIGHYESEVFTKELIGELLTEKFTNFAVSLSETVTNPVNYFK